MDMKHNSALEKYRSPLGALRTGQQVILRFEAPNDGRRVMIVVYENDVGTEYEMSYIQDMWQYDLVVPAEPGVLWYHFAMYLNDGVTYYGVRYGQTTGEGQFYSEMPSSFQLTVYDAGYETPEWFRKSTMYQIFPDRFCQGDKKNLERGASYHRSMGRQVLVHNRWEESPIYAPLEGQQYYSPCDFFGGDLKGIEKQLPYLKEMGITCIYLNPIVEAASNHRYDTANYKSVDPILGSNEDFVRLCRQAEKSGISIMLDGVYSHTGSDSLYFNKKGNYPGKGAYQGKESPYYKWYTFFDSHDQYQSWWGFDTLPEVREFEPDWQEYIITGNNSVFAHWLGLGASGFRLDVADELPDEVIELMRTATKKQDKENVLLGEVWEDATTKESYGVKRQYALGRGLDSVMNYPFRNACINFLLGYHTAYDMKNFFLTQRLNYPLPMYYSLMNLLSSHDVPRIRTVLSSGLTGDNMTREEQASYVVPYHREIEGAKLVRLAEAIQFVMPGVPSIYYGDEYGMNGLKDPFNRGPFSQNDSNMKEFTKRLSRLRQTSDVLKTGYVAFFAVNTEVIAIFRFILDGKDPFGRPANNGVYLTVINRSKEEQKVSIDLKNLEEGIGERQMHLLKNQRYSNVRAMFHDGHTVTVARNVVETMLGPRDFEIFRLL